MWSQEGITTNGKFNFRQQAGQVEALPAHSSIERGIKGLIVVRNGQNIWITPGKLRTDHLTARRIKHGYAVAVRRCTGNRQVEHLTQGIERYILRGLVEDCDCIPVNLLRADQERILC